MTKEVSDILKGFPTAGRDQLIPILQAVQEEYGFLSEKAVVDIGTHLSLPTSKIYGVATFYNQFRFQPKGKYHIMVCRGTACHVKGSKSVLDAIQSNLKIKPNQTSRDGLFSLEVVACIGACGLAPVINVNGEFHAGLTPDFVGDIIEMYRNKEKEQEHAQSN